MPVATWLALIVCQTWLWDNQRPECSASGDNYSFLQRVVTETNVSRFRKSFDRPPIRYRDDCWVSGSINVGFSTPIGAMGMTRSEVTQK
ncbi:uncharacterized protein LOC112459177 isoform X2 [Temnothorax curvispinosus]|uniref:Uncharacterized protein LOC112459177 isoform X2 n=1 Tax=Temnothorax curvispinosus TaxID=300111 RepID=A0A6J1QC77_9HYME|nr:uncharacterized protein LOC112459177 isoform X2 [Temnothorax curvispinosus]